MAKEARLGSFDDLMGELPPVAHPPSSPLRESYGQSSSTTSREPSRWCAWGTVPPPTGLARRR